MNRVRDFLDTSMLRRSLMTAPVEHVVTPQTRILEPSSPYIQYPITTACLDQESMSSHVFHR